MRRRQSDAATPGRVLLLALVACCVVSGCDGVRRQAQRRQDSGRLYVPAPSAESIQAVASATGAAEYEAFTEGKQLVKRLIPPDERDAGLVEHQGVIGRAGVDFPAFPTIPQTGFNCRSAPTGYYADLETDCQVFHICDTSRKISFLCPNGTIFSQSHLICDWWFKVDCASAPALYESSAEYYSNEQKKALRVSQSLSKNADLQSIGSNIQAESRRTSSVVPSTTERLLKHRQRLNDPFAGKTTAKTYDAFFSSDSKPKATQTPPTTARRSHLVQLIANNFGTVPRTTLPSYVDASTYRTTLPTGDFNSLREMQEAAESASFAHNNNRQYLQDFNQKNYRPYPVYTPNVETPKPAKPKTLTTLYDFRDHHLNHVNYEITTKRPTLVPYTKSFLSTVTTKQEPYTRPGISLLKDFLVKEKNKTQATDSSEKEAQATERSSQIVNKENTQNKVTSEAKNSYESVTKIPQTTKKPTYFTETASSDRFDVFSNTHAYPGTTEPSYQERRERLMKKLNLDTLAPSTATEPTEKFYGDLPNRPGLVVPPSLTPKTLHSLAIYYATALDNLSTTATPEDLDMETAPTPYYDYTQVEDEIPGLFSQQTINKYSKLFNHGDKPYALENIKFDPNVTYNELAEDLTMQMSQYGLASSPQIRELAQVFTHALSAYLQDPVQFRKVLSDIRPTQPSFTEAITEDLANTEATTTINEEDQEILGFSDDNKISPVLANLREGKALNVVTVLPTVTDPTTTLQSFEIESTKTSHVSPAWNPFRCCGRISASYTSAATTKDTATTPATYVNAVATNVNSLANNNTDVGTTTENSYTVPKLTGFQNNSSVHDSPYGSEIYSTTSKPFNDYVQSTNLPTAWGIDASDATYLPITNAHLNSFESKKIRTTTPVPNTKPDVYFTESDSVELENDEQLQRAQSQSFVPSQNNNIRQGKQFALDKAVKKPSEDLEAPVFTVTPIPTVQFESQPTTTVKPEEQEVLSTVSSISNNVFTSPENYGTTFRWLNNYDNWQSTIADPITVNDGLRSTNPELSSQTTVWGSNRATTPIENVRSTEQAYSSSAYIEFTTPSNKHEERRGRLLRDPTSTEAADITTIADTVAEKAKEIMGGMNATTTEKLMNVMKKTKSTTVRRLILLLVQTCDDDHNTTAEASKRALLDALMAVSDKDMEEIAKEEATETPTTIAEYDTRTTEDVHRRTEPVPEINPIKPRQFERRGKSLQFDPSIINSLSNPTTYSPKTTTGFVTEAPSSTQAPPRPVYTNRRGVKKFLVRTSPVDPKVTTAAIVEGPTAEARVAGDSPDLKTAADTRALELLKSLYTIAARFG